MTESAPPPPAPSAPPELWSTHPDWWAHRIQVRQDTQLRDLGIGLFTGGIQQVEKLKEHYATIGHEQLTRQQAALDHAAAISKQFFDLQMELLNKKKAEVEAAQEKKADEDARPRVDFTSLGVALLGAIQAIVLGFAPGRSSNKDQAQTTTERPTGAGSEPDQMLLIPEEQAQQVVLELVERASPMELHKLLTDPMEQRRFAERIQQINKPNSTQLAKRASK